MKRETTAVEYRTFVEEYARVRYDSWKKDPRYSRLSREEMLEWLGFSGNPAYRGLSRDELKRTNCA